MNKIKLFGVLAILFVSVLLFVGCSQVSNPGPSPTAKPTTTSRVTPTATPTATPTTTNGPTATTSASASPTPFPTHSWIGQISGVSKYLLHAHFVDANNGWVVGNMGTILKTTSGGTSWSSNSNNLAETLYGIKFVDANKGFAVGSEGTMYKTTNGGTTWTVAALSTDFPTKTFRGITFADAQNGWIVAGDGFGNNGLVLRTTNGGDTWSSCAPEGIDFNLVCFPSASTGWIFGENSFDGTIYKTTNGGTNWGLQVLSDDLTNILFTGASFTSTATGCVVGVNSANEYSNFIAMTNNGGITWLTKEVGVQIVPVGVFMLDPNNTWVIGNPTGTSVIYKTTDEGTTWIDQTPAGSEMDGKNLNSISFVDANHGVAVGSCGVVYYTSDGGTNWTKPASTVTVDNLFGLTSADGGTVWASGSSGVIVKSLDGGATWTTQNHGISDDLNSVSFVDANTGWTIGYYGSIYKTIDGGTNWTSEASGVANLKDVFLRLPAMVGR